MTGGTGGTVDLTGSTGFFVFAGTGAGATINGNSNWMGGKFDVTAGTTPVFSMAPNATLTTNARLYNGPFRITGGGTFYSTAAPNNAVKVADLLP